MMVGHLFVRSTSIVLVDPPLVPGLVNEATKLGRPEAVLLTTRNHTRASAFLHKRTGVPIHLPEQDPNAVDPREAVKVNEIGDFEVYGAGSILGFQAYKFGPEHVLLTSQKELLFGDMAMGDDRGRVMLWPDWYTPGPPYEAYSKELSDSDRKNIKEGFKEMVKTTGATSLLASHGYDIPADLQSKAALL